MDHWQLAFYGACAAVFVLATMPTNQPVPTLGWDKADHFAAFLFLGLLGLRAYRTERLRCQVGLLAFGVGIELIQAFLPYRFAEWRDVVADGAGLVLVQALAVWVFEGSKK